MINVQEQGRNLVFTLGEGDDTLNITVKPVNGKVGRAIFEIWLRLLANESTDLEGDSNRMARLALGAENCRLIEGDNVNDDGEFIDAEGKLIPEGKESPGLRQEEAEQVINGAIFWQMQGGGWAVVVEFMAGGLPKAVMLIMDRNGLLTTTEQSNRSLSGALASPTKRDAFGVTTTPSGSAT